jgi:hypothetical protein
MYSHEWIRVIAGYVKLNFKVEVTI